MSGGMRHRRRAGYYVPRTTIRDESISYTALGLLTYLLDRPRGWRVRGETLAVPRSNSEGQVMKALGELRTSGYYRLERRRLLDGKFVMGTAISEEPVTEWITDNAEYSGKAVPLEQQPDGRFLVRHKDGTLTSDGFDDLEDIDPDAQLPDFPEPEAGVPDFPEPEREVPDLPVPQAAGPGDAGAANLGSFRREDQEKKNQEEAPLPAVGDLTRRNARDTAAVPAGKEDQASTTGAAFSGQLALAAAAPAVPPPTLTVFAALPQVLRRRIGAGAKGKVLDAIAREIGVHGRTMAEMAERVGRRWEGWQRLNPNSRISNPLAVALTLVERRHCANVRCEDGLDLDSGSRCTACSGRGPRRTAPSGDASPAPVVPIRSANTAGQRVVTQAPTHPPVAEVLAFRPKPEPEPQEVFHLTPPEPERPAMAQALQAARAAVGHRPLTARDRELQDALKIMCPMALCGADEGALCVSGDGMELLLRHTHGARVIEARQRRLAGTLDDETASAPAAGDDVSQPEVSA